MPRFRRGSRTAYRRTPGAMKLLLDENLSRRIVTVIQADSDIACVEIG